MRAVAILGLSNASKAKAQFQRLTGAEWTPSNEQADVAVVFGGDGTVHRHLPELVERNIPLLVVPCGSGNDFARALNLRGVRDSLAAWRGFMAGKNNVRTIDLGMIRELGEGESSASGAPAPHKPAPHYFCCVAGVGIDGSITTQCNQLPTWLRAHGGYALCAPREFFRFAPVPMKISLNGEVSVAKPAMLAAVANAPAYGGGMRIAPQAKLDDGKLDVCVVRAMNALKLFYLFPTVYFGKHLDHREVEYAQTETVRIETDRPLDVYADGEFVCQTPVDISVARGILKVLTP